MKHSLMIGLACLAGIAPSIDCDMHVESADGTAMPAYVQIAGPNSMVRQREILRITDADTWREQWLEHTAEQTRRGGLRHPFPVVDFNACMVIAVFGGEAWNTQGEAVDSIVEFEEHVRVRFDSMTYQTAGPDGGGIRCTPYGFFVVPKAHKRLVVEENVQGLIGHPPTWKVQAEFEALSR